MHEEIHEGGCLCGAARYRTRGQPARAGICHCRYCQLRTGSAFGLSCYFPKGKVELLQGVLKDYLFKTESGRNFTTHFCPNCATTVMWSLEMQPDLTGIAGGTFDPPTFWFKPGREIFTRSAAPYIQLDVAEHHETTSSYAPIQKDAAPLAGGPRG